MPDRVPLAQQPSHKFHISHVSVAGVINLTSRNHAALYEHRRREQVERTTEDHRQQRREPLAEGDEAAVRANDQRVAKQDVNLRVPAEVVAHEGECARQVLLITVQM